MKTKLEYIRYFFLIIRSFVKSKIYSSTGNKTLAILRLDAIGDYILFRNFLEKIRKSDKYKGYRITLIGNVAWKELAIEYDSMYIDEFIWIHTAKIEDAKYYKTIKSQLSNLSFDALIVPQFRRYSFHDELATIIVAKTKIVSLADFVERQSLKSKIANYFYPEIIDVPPQIKFEFHRNKFFFEKLLEEEIAITKPTLNLNIDAINKIDKDDYIVIFPGASDPKRVWPAEKFIEVVREIIELSDLNIILLGGISEKDVCQNIVLSVGNERVINKAGNTTLTDLVNLIAQAKLVISNETSAIHISAAVNTPSICLLGGGHFNRFMPYISEDKTDKIPTPVYSAMDCFNCNWWCRFELEDDVSYPCLEKIQVEKVMNLIHPLLSN